MKNGIKAIPTLYNGTQFRSRLEARWAATFDLLGWTWEYETLDLDGYIPDFLVNKRIIEVKPATSFADYAEAQTKIERSGWTGEASVVGAVVGSYLPDHDLACMGVDWERFDGERHWGPWLVDGSNRITNAWRQAGNLTQWKAPVEHKAPRSQRERHQPVPKAEIFAAFNAIFDEIEREKDGR